MAAKIINRLINWSLITLFFLVPLFFTSVNFELFEFNKMLLVYLLASFNLCLWILKKYVSGNWHIDKSPFDILLLIFLASQALSFIFSIDRHTSLFGYYSRFNGGLLSLLAYAVIYKVIADQKDPKLVKQIIFTSLLAGSIVSLYAILEHFGHSFSCLMFTGKFDVACWVQDVQNRVYATLGQPNWLAAYLIVLVPLTWGLTLNSNIKIQNAKSNAKFRIIYYVLFTAFYSSLLFTKSRSGFLGFATSFVTFWSLVFFMLKKQVLKPFLTFSISLFLLTFIIGSPFSQFDKYFSWNGIKSLVSPTNQLPNQQPNQPSLTTLSPGPQLEVGGTESGIIRKIVWQGAFDIFKHYPLVGTGPETFAYSYYQYRPMAHNLVSEWDFLYNKAHNEYLNYLATTGGVGLGSYLLFIMSFYFITIKNIKYQISNIKNKSINIKLKSLNFEIDFEFYILIFALIAAFTGILVSNFFGFSVVISNLYLFTIPALVSVLLTKNNNQQSTINNQHPISVISVLVVISVISVCAWQIANLWRADYYYNKGDQYAKQQLFLPAYENYNQAIQLYRNEPAFKIDMAFAAANLAVATLSLANPDATTAGSLIEIATILTDQAYQTSPYNLNLLKTKIKTYYALSLIDPQYHQKTIEAIKDAMTKAPTDPKLVYNLGLMYGKDSDVQLAISTIQRSVEMKPNFADARNALAQYYETLGLYSRAVEQLEYIDTYINPNDATIKERIANLKQKLD